MRVEDDGPGLPAGWRLTVHQRVGLSNTLERLKRPYGDSGYQFAVTSEPGKGARVDVSLPFRNEGQIPDAPQSYAENSHAGR